MKRKLKTFIALFIFMMMLPVCVNAIRSLEILTLDVTNNNGTLRVKGNAEDGVLAVAVVVYKEGEETPSYMQTCAYDKGYDCELTKKFEAGSYVIKVADYAGGDYISKKITIETEREEKKENNPKTGDNIISYIIIMSLSLISLSGFGLYLNKKND